ncbi:hypothetical protein MnTg02_02317 [bacterium MnTg02]|nr:hypothetical protein MnTg02_02317 [bacterium MnTg02]
MTKKQNAPIVEAFTKAKEKRDSAGADLCFAEDAFTKADAEFAAYEILDWFSCDKGYDELADALTRVAHGGGLNAIDLKARLLDTPF